MYSFTPDGDTTFLVYVYGFKTPFCLTIAFTSFPILSEIQRPVGEQSSNADHDDEFTASEITIVVVLVVVVLLISLYCVVRVVRRGAKKPLLREDCNQMVESSVLQTTEGNISNVETLLDTSDVYNSNLDLSKSPTKNVDESQPENFEMNTPENDTKLAVSAFSKDPPREDISSSLAFALQSQKNNGSN